MKLDDVAEWAERQRAEQRKRSAKRKSKPSAIRAAIDAGRWVAGTYRPPGSRNRHERRAAARRGRT